MNILFYLRSIGFGFGGIEVVTIQLANKFKAEGNHVVIYALHQGDSDIVDRIDKEIPLYIGYGNCVSNKNIWQVRDILLKHEIEVAVNQMGLPIVPIKVLDAARKGLNVRLISFFHNDPGYNGRISSCDIAIDKTNNPLKKYVLRMMRIVSKAVTSHSMRYVYNHSDVYAVLSDSYKSRFVEFTGIKNPSKLIVQTNPVTIDVTPVDMMSKQKEVIYCGRIDSQQKRVERLIDVWRLVENDFPDWKFSIVGDGVGRSEVEKRVADYGLKNIHFEGFQHPVEYYKRASILVLSSEYEGFPLVLAECMSFGVIPVVLDSYAAAKDIIHDCENGFLVPYIKKNGFDASLFASKVKELMGDKAKLCRMYSSAIETSKEYSLDTIFEQWMKILQELT